MRYVKHEEKNRKGREKIYGAAAYVREDYTIVFSPKKEGVPFPPIS